MFMRRKCLPKELMKSRSHLTKRQFFLKQIDKAVNQRTHCFEDKKFEETQIVVIDTEKKNGLFDSNN